MGVAKIHFTDIKKCEAQEFLAPGDTVTVLHDQSFVLGDGSTLAIPKGQVGEIKRKIV